MPGSIQSVTFLGTAIAATLSACTAPDLASSCPIPEGATSAQQLAALQACYGCTEATWVDPRLHKDVDILFVIDNSPSMSPKQKQLAQAIPGFIQAIEATQSNYHVGIVTTDLGFNVPNGTEIGIPFPGNVPAACNTAAGDDGVLQNVPCTKRNGLSQEAQQACNTLCPDPSFVPQNGVRFISKQDGITNVPVALANGMDMGPQLAFQCMALVGDAGCGIEMQLESARRALDNHRPDNQGFNRGTSVLAVIFITDEDDCSIQQANRMLWNPATPNAASAACTTPTATPGVSADCFNVDYRCMATDLSCAEPMNTPGRKTDCHERQDTLLNPLSRYVEFFSSLPNPNIVLAGIWTPTLLDNPMSIPTPQKDGQLFIDYVNGTMDSSGLNRGRQTEAACYNATPGLTTDPSGYFGQAQLRLSSFIRNFQSNTISEHSICDPLAQNGSSGYPGALQVIANNIIGSMHADCLADAPTVVAGQPQCVVGYVDATNPHSTPDMALPACSATCCSYFATDPAPNLANDPNQTPNPHLQAKLAACGADPDCYCAVPSTVNCQQGAVFGLWRAGNAVPPAGKVVNIQCAGRTNCDAAVPAT